MIRLELIRCYAQEMPSERVNIFYLWFNDLYYSHYWICDFNKLAKLSGSLLKSADPPWFERLRIYLTIEYVEGLLIWGCLLV